MCGIAGYATNHPKKPGQLARLGTLLAVFNESRGSHSWGWTDGSQIIKDTGAISSGLDQIPFADPSGICLIHTRMATTGAHSKANAHPFQVDVDGTNVIGVHNGIVTNHHELNRKYKRNCDVDSQHLFHHLAERRNFADINGYGTIVFFMTVDGERKLYFSKFNGGSLYIGEMEGGGLVWSSDKDHLSKALRAVNLKAELFNVDNAQLYFYGPDKDTLFRSGDTIKVGSRISTASAYQGGGYDHNRGSNNYSSGYNSNGINKSTPVDGIIKIRILSDEAMAASADDQTEVIDVVATPVARTPRQLYLDAITDHVQHLNPQVTVYIEEGKSVGSNRVCISCEESTQRIVGCCISCLAALLEQDTFINKKYKLPVEIKLKEPTQGNA